jgi:hypothetical protein
LKNGINSNSLLISKSYRFIESFINFDNRQFEWGKTVEDENNHKNTAIDFAYRCNLCLPKKSRYVTLINLIE